MFFFGSQSDVMNRVLGSVVASLFILTIVLEIVS